MSGDDAPRTVHDPGPARCWCREIHDIGDLMALSHSILTPAEPREETQAGTDSGDKPGTLARPWIVHHREGWCALPLGAVPDPAGANDPTLCGYEVTMRGGSQRGEPTCPECVAELKEMRTDDFIADPHYDPAAAWAAGDDQALREAGEHDD